MHRVSKLKVSEINPYLICKLCSGYFIDPCTAQECLHSYCRTCIVNHLNYNCTCPICGLVIHKTRPLELIRHDQTLQDLVYKLVPGVFKKEMERRRLFYAENPDTVDETISGESRGEVKNDREILAEDDCISMVLVHSPNGDAKEAQDTTLTKIYLRCPASFPMASLKKFIRAKYDLSTEFLIEVFHSDESLSDHYTLMDIAYIYTWRRTGPLRIFYTIYQYDPSDKKDSTNKESCETRDDDKDSHSKPIGDPATVTIKEGSQITEGSSLSLSEALRQSHLTRAVMLFHQFSTTLHQLSVMHSLIQDMKFEEQKWSFSEMRSDLLNITTAERKLIQMTVYACSRRVHFLEPYLVSQVKHNRTTTLLHLSQGQSSRAEEQYEGWEQELKRYQRVIDTRDLVRISY